MQEMQEKVSFSKKYDDLTVEECLDVLLDSKDYWDIDQQLSHPRWDIFREFDGQSWKDVARKAMTDYVTSDREEAAMVGVMFFIGKLRLERKLTGGQVFMTQA